MRLLKDKIYLTQTDTTVGFLSNDYKKLNKIKNRDISKKVLIEVDSFKSLKNIVKVPLKFRKKIRRARKTTFIYPNNKAIRVIKDINHLNFLKKFSHLYSTSANKTNEEFNLSFAISKADIIVYNKYFTQNNPSKIIKINKNRLKKIR